jgi:hypothetical protein
MHWNLIDTPGLNDTNMPDHEVWNKIVDNLQESTDNI